MKQIFQIASCLLLGLVLACNSTVAYKVYELKTNHLKSPLGLEENPVFSWQMKEVLPGFYQQNYRILVASNPRDLELGKTDLWDSGVIFSAQSLGIPYTGKDLNSGKRAYWKVILEDEKGLVHESEPTWFEMGLTNPKDWKASWIAATEAIDSIPELTAAPYFRKNFPVNKPIQAARLYISGLGYYEAFINGTKVGDHVLDPAMTRYDKSAKYVVYDVTELLAHGDNAIGVVLRNGWYNQHTREAWDFDQAPWRGVPVLRAQLKIVDEEGNEHWIYTNDSWKFTLDGPILFDSVHNGETYEAGKEMKDWTMPDFEAHNWKTAHLVSGPKGKMVAQVMPAIRIVQSLEPKTHWAINDSTLILGKISPDGQILR